jgi:hypothetical protein
MEWLKTMNSKELWTPWNVHAIHDQRSEAFAKSRSRSRFKNERITVM